MTLPYNYNIKWIADNMSSLASFIGDQSLRYAVIETVLHPVSIRWQRGNVDSAQGCGPEGCGFSDPVEKSRGGKSYIIILHESCRYEKNEHFMQFYILAESIFNTTQMTKIDRPMCSSYISPMPNQCLVYNETVLVCK
jgi:hypothetical protein